MTASTPNVVVGVDGSDGSRLALAWAVEEATRRHLPLLICAPGAPTTPRRRSPL